MDKEQEILDDINNIIYNVFDIASVASAYYDEIVGIYYREGEEAAYKRLKEVTEEEYNRHD